MPSDGAATIDLGAIEDQLQHARQSAGGATATTMNLIVYVDRESLQGRASERAKALSEKYPARVMILHRDEERVKIHTSVRKIGESQTVNAEMIELGVAHMSPQAICSAINTLRVADIPNVLWWTSDTVANELLFDDMIVMMDTIIVDSSGIDGEEFAIRELAEFFAGNRNVLLRDLAYMRLAPWQDMVAQFFDDAAFVADVHRIERVEITAGSDAEGYYLISWLASRLHWKPCGRFALCDADGRKIEVVMKRNGELRRVLRIALSTQESVFCAELTDSPDTVCMSVSGAKSSPQRCSPLQHIDNMSLLEKAFLIPAHDEVFESSLRVLHDLLAFHT
ncbi:MAG: glucose-6-phosphate dehydrogenase assembly protein OpcA [Candidatus Eremiobacteraeota bacterium]|nr:glucose-6-phosphate dehydrogenase assembly protein OpcA [Candidatus Eremiobacteraeota bacterium]